MRDEYKIGKCLERYILPVITEIVLSYLPENLWDHRREITWHKDLVPHYQYIQGLNMSNFESVVAFRWGRLSIMEDSCGRYFIEFVKYAYPRAYAAVAADISLKKSAIYYDDFSIGHFSAYPIIQKIIVKTDSWNYQLLRIECIDVIHVVFVRQSEQDEVRKKLELGGFRFY